MNRIKFVAIGGFLGAGKTTTALRALEVLRGRGLKGAYIANDQGEGLVDSALAREMQVEGGEVVGGCFCCRFEDLIRTAMQIAEALQPDIILAEAVGSCTDLVATVVNPLKMKHARRFEVAPYTVVVDPERYVEFSGETEEDELVYLFDKQIEEAQIIAVNKIDRLSGEGRARLTRKLQDLYPRAEVLAYAAQEGTNMDELVNRWLGQGSADAQVLELDYDAYAQAEAGLAWLNAAGTVRSASEFSAMTWVQSFLSSLARSLDEHGARIGHLKASVKTDTGLAKASVIGNRDEVHFSHVRAAPAREGEVLVNARAELEPEQLETFVKDAFEQADTTCHASSQLARLDVFSPARPQPTYRLADDGRSLDW